MNAHRYSPTPINNALGKAINVPIGFFGEAYFSASDAPSITIGILGINARRAMIINTIDIMYET